MYAYPLKYEHPFLNKLIHFRCCSKIRNTLLFTISNCQIKRISKKSFDDDDAVNN